MARVFTKADMFGKPDNKLPRLTATSESVLLHEQFEAGADEPRGTPAKVRDFEVHF